MKARIVEVFDSIQGEGLYLGEKQIFVRFFGCNLSCSFCDTRPDRFMEYEPHELISELKLYNRKYHSISFTGGEPLLAKDFLKEVLQATSKDGHRHYLETNGTLHFELEELINYIDIVAMDVKLPSSSGMGNLWQQHRRFLEIASKKEVFLKAIIGASTEEAELQEVFKMIKEVRPATVLVLQPNSYDSGEVLDNKINRCKDLCAQNNIVACVIPQIHKIAGIR
ncbi:MAG: 7-carboxy-7-deazaguanine synthase QueE [Candidatus Omnitrophota bacterium]|jgi:organic radical activating enzyme